MPTFERVAKRLAEIASAYNDKAASALEKAVLALQQRMVSSLASQDTWAYRDMGRAIGDLQSALSASGFDDIAHDFGQAAIEMAHEVQGLDIVQFTDADASALQAALQVKYDQWGALSQDAQDELRGMLAKNAVTPVSASDLAAELADYLEGDFKAHAATYIETALHAQIRATWAQVGRGMGGDVTYHYEGPDDDRTRDFCAEQLDSGQDLTEEEIHALDNGQDLDAFEFGGGWNCRHQWVPNDPMEE